MVLKNKLDKYKEDMLALLDPKDKAAAAKSFPINTADAYSNRGKNGELG